MTTAYDGHPEEYIWRRDARSRAAVRRSAYRYARLCETRDRGDKGNRCADSARVRDGSARRDRPGRCVCAVRFFGPRSRALSVPTRSLARCVCRTAHAAAARHAPVRRANRVVFALRRAARGLVNRTGAVMKNII